MKTVASSNERRKDHRYLFEEKLIIKVTSPSTSSLNWETVTGITQDSSLNGLRISLNQSIEADTMLLLWIKILGHPGTFLLTGYTKWCKEMDTGGKYLIGLEIQPELSEDLETWQEMMGS